MKLLPMNCSFFPFMMPRHVLLLSLFVAAITHGTAAADAPAAKPNILFILIDDLNDWIGALDGHPQAKTPHIDRLAARGMLFTNAHCQGTMCNPSRVSILWGRRPSSTGFYENHYPVTNEPDFLETHVSLPQHFSQHGYQTLSAGKVFHTAQASDAHVIGPNPGYWRQGLDQAVHQKPIGIHDIWDFGPQDYAETEFTDHIIATWASDRLKEPRDKPFFLSIGFIRPHVPFFPPRSMYDALGDAELPPTKDNDWADIPDAARELTMSNQRIPTHAWLLEQGRWQEAVNAYLACVHWVDQQVGRLLEALEAGPHAQNTIVVLFSDHGYHLGEKQRWSKFSLWERTTRVPLIINVPGGVKGKTAKPVELLSLYPTLVDLAGLPTNPKLEGVSLRPLLENPDAPWDHVAISTLGQNNHAVRDSRWRYIRYADGSEELYDHQKDPNEWDNLARNLSPEQAAVIERLREHLPKANAPQRNRTP